jgi:hypothetical protein
MGVRAKQKPLCKSDLSPRTLSHHPLLLGAGINPSFSIMREEILSSGSHYKYSMRKYMVAATGPDNSTKYLSPITFKGHQLFLRLYNTTYPSLRLYVLPHVKHMVHISLTCCNKPAGTITPLFLNKKSK